jgi:hypothetical protein
MALTKATYSMIVGASYNILDFIPPAEHAAIQGGTSTYDCLAAINAAIAALPQTFDVFANFSGNEYSGKPGPMLYFPGGTYPVSGAIVIEKNNINIRGDGWNNSIIKYTNTGAPIQGVVRFLNAFNGEMSDMGIDGGLPYDPDLTETYGADAGLICDLTPFFTSRNLWIANCRKSGLVAIHLWESFFENLQVRNTGYFTEEGVTLGAGIYFCADAAIKQSSNALGAGFESQNTVFVKAKLVPIGGVVHAQAPTQNITFIEPITENRDFPTQFDALSYTKYKLSAFQNNFKIQGGYFYGHAHPFATNATLFEIGSNVPGIAIKNFYVYTSVPVVGEFPEVTKIFNVGGQHNVCFDGLIIDDNDAKLTAPFTILTGAGYPGIVYGDIMYNSATTVTAAALIGANNLGYKGTLTCVNTVSQVANRNTYFANARPYNTLTATNQESFSCRAWVNFNGTTGAIRGSGNVSSVTRNSAGNYTVNFTDAMPDTNYVTNVSANRVNTATESTEVGTVLQVSVGVANRDGATYYDPTVVCVTVHR